MMRTKAIAAALKWCGVLMCAALMLAWALSGWVYFGWGATRYKTQSFSHARVTIANGGLRVYMMADHMGLSGAFPYTGWTYGHVRAAPRWQVWLAYSDRASWPIFTIHDLFIPLWAPLLVCGPLTVRLWHRGRPRPGYCICGYTRAGLAGHAPCPECGRAPELRQ